MLADEAKLFATVAQALAEPETDSYAINPVVVIVKQESTTMPEQDESQLYYVVQGSIYGNATVYVLWSPAMVTYLLAKAEPGKWLMS